MRQAVQIKNSNKTVLMLHWIVSDLNPTKRAWHVLHGLPPRCFAQIMNLEADALMPARPQTL